MKKNVWGQTLSVDLYECNYSALTNPKILKKFCRELCDKIDMIPVGQPIIKRFGKGELEGYSLMQFIETSSITIHADEFGNKAFIDIFSCKLFNDEGARNFCKDFFKADRMKYRNFYRG